MEFIVKKLGTLKGFLQAIKGEIDSESSESVESDDVISDDEENQDGYTWIKSQFSC